MFGKVFVVFQELFIVFADMGHRTFCLREDELEQLTTNLSDCGVTSGMIKRRLDRYIISS